MFRSARRLALASALLLAGCGRKDSPLEAQAHRLVARSAASATLLSDLRELTETIGARPTGSEASRRAVAWAEGKLAAAGLRTEREPFTVPHLWLPGSVEAALTAPEPIPLDAIALPGSPPTSDGAGSADADLLDAGTGLEGVRRLGASARGAVLLLRTAPGSDSPVDASARPVEAAELLAAAAAAGARGLLVQSPREGGLLPRHPLTRDGLPAPLPVALLSRADAERIQPHAARGHARLRLSLRPVVGGPFEATNLVATLGGRERPAEAVLLAAHLDSWDGGTGAEDNGVNVAVALDVARALGALSRPPRRTVKIVLFDAEEREMAGSRAWAERHAGELDSLAAVVVFDLGSGRTWGLYVNGHAELEERAREALSSLPDLRGTVLLRGLYAGTDNLPFLLRGVPNAVAMQDLARYASIRHTQADVLAAVDGEQARRNAGLAAALVWGLAESDRPKARRLTGKALDALLARLPERPEGPRDAVSTPAPGLESGPR